MQLGVVLLWASLPAAEDETYHTKPKTSQKRQQNSFTLWVSGRSLRGPG